jgi:diacylglycerol kinase
MSDRDEDAGKSPFRVVDGVVRTGALKNSFAGYADAWRNEGAFRPVVIVAGVLVVVACFLPVGAVERALVIGAPR